jgi:hypothetical protein
MRLQPMPVSPIDDKGETPENQLLQLRAWRARMGYLPIR